MSTWLLPSCSPAPAATSRRPRSWSGRSTSRRTISTCIAVSPNSPQPRTASGLPCRERAALVALDPPDRAVALYELALAQRNAGLPERARRTVLRALEVAPGYDPAQELLLELVGEGS